MTLIERRRRRQREALADWHGTAVEPLLDHADGEAWLRAIASLRALASWAAQSCGSLAAAFLAIEMPSPLVPAVVDDDDWSSVSQEGFDTEWLGPRGVGGGEALGDSGSAARAALPPSVPCEASPSRAPRGRVSLAAVGAYFSQPGALAALDAADAATAPPPGELPAAPWAAARVTLLVAPSLADRDRDIDYLDFTRLLHGDESTRSFAELAAHETARGAPTAGPPSKQAPALPGASQRAERAIVVRNRFLQPHATSAAEADLLRAAERRRLRFATPIGDCTGKEPSMGPGGEYVRPAGVIVPFAMGCKARVAHDTPLPHRHAPPSVPATASGAACLRIMCVGAGAPAASSIISVAQAGMGSLDAHLAAPVALPRQMRAAGSAAAIVGPLGVSFPGWTDSATRVAHRWALVLVPNSANGVPGAFASGGGGELVVGLLSGRRLAGGDDASPEWIGPALVIRPLEGSPNATPGARVCYYYAGSPSSPMGPSALTGDVVVCTLSRSVAPAAPELDVAVLRWAQHGASPGLGVILRLVEPVVLTADSVLQPAAACATSTIPLQARWILGPSGPAAPDVLLCGSTPAAAAASGASGAPTRGGLLVAGPDAALVESLRHALPPAPGGPPVRWLLDACSQATVLRMRAAAAAAGAASGALGTPVQIGRLPVRVCRAAGGDGGSPTDCGMAAPPALPHEWLLMTNAEEMTYASRARDAGEIVSRAATSPWRSLSIAGCAVTSGRWYFEVTAASGAEARISAGWVPVGQAAADAVDSAAGPASSAPAWQFTVLGQGAGRVGEAAFGTPLRPGDVLCCALDADAGTLAWGRNGCWEHPWGVGAWGVAAAGAGLRPLVRVGPPARPSGASGAPENGAPPQLPDPRVGSYVTRWNIGRLRGSRGGEGEEEGGGPCGPEFRFPPPVGFSGLASALLGSTGAEEKEEEKEGPPLPSAAARPAALFLASDPAGTLIAPLATTVAARPWLRRRLAAQLGLAEQDGGDGGGAFVLCDEFAAADAAQEALHDRGAQREEEQQELVWRVEDSLRSMSARHLAVSTRGHLISVALPSFRQQLSLPQSSATAEGTASSASASSWLALNVLVRSPNAPEWPALAFRLAFRCEDTGDASEVLSAPTAVAAAALERDPLLSASVRADMALQRTVGDPHQAAWSPPADPLAIADSGRCAVEDAREWLCSALLPRNVSGVDAFVRAPISRALPAAAAAGPAAALVTAAAAPPAAALAATPATDAVPAAEQGVVRVAEAGPAILCRSDAPLPPPCLLATRSARPRQQRRLRPKQRRLTRACEPRQRLTRHSLRRPLLSFRGCAQPLPPPPSAESRPSSRRPSSSSCGSSSSSPLPPPWLLAACSRRAPPCETGRALRPLGTCPLSTWPLLRRCLCAAARRWAPRSPAASSWKGASASPLSTRQGCPFRSQRRAGGACRLMPWLRTPTCAVRRCRGRANHAPPPSDASAAQLRWPSPSTSHGSAMASLPQLSASHRCYRSPVPLAVWLPPWWRSQHGGALTSASRARCPHWCSLTPRPS